MKIYKVTLKENGYDQYDAFVVRAEDENAAIALLQRKYPPGKLADLVRWEKGYTVEEVSAEGLEEEILGSFNAG